MTVPVAAHPSNMERKRKRLEQSDAVTATRKSVKTESTHNIAQLEEQIKASSKHYNHIATLLTVAKLEINDSANDLPSVLSLCRVFCILGADRRLSIRHATTDRAKQVVTWLNDRYGEYQKLLIRMLKHGNDRRREISLSLAMQLVRAECASAEGDSGSGSMLKRGFFIRLVSKVLQVPEGQKLCEHFADSFIQNFDDLKYFTFEAIIRALTASDADQTILDNCFALLSRIEPPSLDDCEFDTFSNSASQNKKVSAKISRKQGEKAWLKMLLSPLSTDQRNVLLSSITYRVIPWIRNVEVLMDFLTDSYNSGGATSLLALSGLFYMIQEKNLDYPDFFLKLYSLLDTQLLSSENRSRFFRLLNTFMSSTHLPAAIAASFIKKLARLALHAPPAGIIAVIPWIYNMLNVHPSCTFMIHREMRTTVERKELEDYGLHDCFDSEERDPMGTNAIDSCLWELETLQSHYHPTVASLAKIISEQFTKASYNLDDFLDHSYGSLVDSELGRDIKKTPVVEFEIPKTIFVQSNGDATLETLMAHIKSDDPR